MKNIILFFIVISTISCSSNQEKITFKSLQGSAFGTTYSITYKDNLNRDFSKGVDSIIYIMNRSLSTYIPNSDISKINKGDATIIVDTLFTEVFQKSEQIFIETNGFFDPTIGTLVNAWGFGPEEAIPYMDSLKVKQLMTKVGFQKVKLLNGRIIKEHTQIYLDFNAIAKGYGVDLIGRFLEEKDCENYLIELGGEIRAIGRSPKNKLWRVGIEDPNEDGSRSTGQIVVLLDNEAMATSGNYRKFKIDASGKKYVHTINALTGFASESDLLSATVISNLDCSDVDGYATSFMAMGYEKTLDFVDRHKELKIYLIYIDSEGNTKNYTSPEILLRNKE